MGEYDQKIGDILNKIKELEEKIKQFEINYALIIESKMEISKIAARMENLEEKMSALSEGLHDLGNTAGGMRYM